MISTTWLQAPADLLGRGGLDARPASVPAPCGSAPSIAVRLRPVTGQPFGAAVVIEPGAPVAGAQDNSTTLGNHSSGRPQS